MTLTCGGSNALYKTTIFGSLALLIIFYKSHRFIGNVLTTKFIPQLDRRKSSTFDNISSSSFGQDLIVIMIPKSSKDLVSRFQLLDISLSDNFTTPLLVMHNDHPDEDRLIWLANITKRQMMFLDISSIFNVFPSDFDAYRTKPTWQKRGRWNYQLMIRFWFKILFELPQFKSYEYIMRLDDDSRILGKWINVFQEMRTKHAVYFANIMGADSDKTLPGTKKLKQLAIEYIALNNITVKQPEMIRSGLHDTHIRTYYNNFEVMKLEFFRRRNVRHWIEEVDQTNGIFKYRWGDAPLRYITLAMFAEKHEILHRTQYHLPYCHPC